MRYLVLYVYGGVYLDLDLQPLIGFDAMLKRLQEATAINGNHTVRVHRVFCIGARKILPFEGANGFIIAPPGDPFFLTLAHSMMQQVDLASDEYGANVKRFYSALAVRFPAIREYSAIEDAYFLREVEVARFASSSPSYTINALPEEPVMLSNGWAGLRWPEA